MWYQARSANERRGSAHQPAGSSPSSQRSQGRTPSLCRIKRPALTRRSASRRALRLFGGGLSLGRSRRAPSSNAHGLRQCAIPHIETSRMSMAHAAQRAMSGSERSIVGRPTAGRGRSTGRSRRASSAPMLGIDAGPEASAALIAGELRSKPASNAAFVGGITHSQRPHPASSHRPHSAPA
jgi:hypothetical protein